MLLYHSLAVALPLLSLSSAQSLPSDIIGTWSTKSNKTHTGPKFYDPTNEEFQEPTHPGISYSFNEDGFYETAYYRAVANPKRPDCPKGLMQWQHGSWEYLSNGSLVLTPIKVDGRQLESNPCAEKNGLYTRYNQSEIMERYSVYEDLYHHVQRLDLYQFDGSPMHPMYLSFRPPQMLPTTTLNPIETTASATGDSSKLRKRGAGAEMPLDWKARIGSVETVGRVAQHINADWVWWVGLSLTGLGGMLYMGPRRMGVQI